MAIADYYSKKKEIIKKVKAIKVVQRQTQTEITRRLNISVITSKVTD
jgi:DNA-binding transcriptional regulator LsrR (DeoR family)